MAAPTRLRLDLAMLAVLLFGQLLLMASSLRQDASSEVLERGVASASRPAVGASRAAAGGIGGVLAGLRAIGTARSENVRLTGEVERARQELARYREAAAESARLRRLLGMREDLAPRSIGASVVTAKLTSQSWMLVIDRGTDAGVRPDQAVVTWGGAVGRVVFADRAFAKVRLVTDPNSGIAGVVQRSRAAGMVLGRGDGALDMSYVPKYEDVVAGDRVVTSGLDGVFPAGFDIGTVTAVRDTAGVSRDIRLEPEVDFRAVREVLVLLDPTGGTALALPEAENGP